MTVKRERRPAAIQARYLLALHGAPQQRGWWYRGQRHRRPGGYSVEEIRRSLFTKGGVIHLNTVIRNVYWYGTVADSGSPELLTGTLEIDWNTAPPMLTIPALQGPPEVSR